MRTDQNWINTFYMITQRLLWKRQNYVPQQYSGEVYYSLHCTRIRQEKHSTTAIVYQHGYLWEQDNKK